MYTVTLVTLFFHFIYQFTWREANHKYIIFTKWCCPTVTKAGNPVKQAHFSTRAHCALVAFVVLEIYWSYISDRECRAMAVQLCYRPFVECWSWSFWRLHLHLFTPYLTGTQTHILYASCRFHCVASCLHGAELITNLLYPSLHCFCFAADNRHY